MTPYRHRQIAIPMLIAMSVAEAGIVIAMVIVPEARLWLAIVLVFMFIAAVIFGSLAVTVDNHSVRVAFGPGIIRRTFLLSSIKRSTAVRNKWYYGWGIRLTPHGWMFNVSGLDAVELEFNNGRKFRIGTNDPQGLLVAIEQASRRPTPIR